MPIIELNTWPTMSTEEKELQAFCKEQGIQMEAWSPLMQGQLLDNEILQEIAETW